MNKDEFILECEKLGIKISTEIFDKLSIYMNMVLEYNKHTNLTRITNEKEFYLKHFYDSLTLSKIIAFNNQILLDVGTGAGFPGMVLKIVFPKLKITLIDSLNKRIVFLNAVKKQLELEDVDIIHTRAEDYIKNNREKYDIVVSRAVANLNVLCELCIPYVKKHGYFIAMKTDDLELINSEKCIKTLGCVVEETIHLKLYNNDDKRFLIKIRKNNKTNVKYPRKYSEIKKNPL